MRDTELYARILGIEEPWRVVGVELRLEEGEVVVVVEHGAQGKLACPECGAAATGYDTRERRWRHLDTCQYRTILLGRVPRVRCPEHGVRMIRVPWAEPRSPFTALFEALVIDWLKAANPQAVARQLGLSWDQVDGVMQRAVRRGLARRELSVPRQAGVDETSFAIVDQLRQLPGEMAEQLPLSHHRLLLSVKDPQAKLALAEKAISQQLSKRELEREVRRRRKRRRRTPRSPALRLLRRGMGGEGCSGSPPRPHVGCSCLPFGAEMAGRPVTTLLLGSRKASPRKVALYGDGC